MYLSTMLILVIFAVCTLTTAKSEVFQVNVTRGQVFVYEISNRLIWTIDEQQNEFRYVLTGADGPDLPPWVFTKYHNDDQTMHIFGAAPKDSEIMRLEIQTSVTSMQSYKTQNCTMILNIMDYIDEIRYEIYVRISNANIENMLDLKRPKDLIEIFENYFWEQSKGKLFLTFLASSEDLGFRLPLSPNDSTGVVLHLGSAVNFSQQLIDLQNETIPLSKHCPVFNKRVTVERFFRPKNFVMDWCFFKLVDHYDCQYIAFSEKHFTKESCDSTRFNISNGILRDDIDLLTDKEKLPKSDILRMLIILVFVPSILLAFGIVSWLTSFMCINHAKLYDPYSDDYFETVFYICEDFRRSSNSNEDYVYEDEYDNKQTLFSF